MPRRIEVELTSRRDDGTWTWRAAGAREPKGSLDATLLPSDAAVGMVLKAEVEMDIDGIVVTAITPPKAARTEPQRLEIIGGRRNDEQLVTTTLVRRGRDERRPRGDRRARPGHPAAGFRVSTSGRSTSKLRVSTSGLWSVDIGYTWHILGQAPRAQRGDAHGFDAGDR